MGCIIWSAYLRRLASGRILQNDQSNPMWCEKLRTCTATNPHLYEPSPPLQMKTLVFQVPFEATHHLQGCCRDTNRQVKLPWLHTCDQLKGPHLLCILHPTSCLFNQFIDTYRPKYFFLAHTLNDQAENVLLGLARGSGARSLSGMAIENNIYVRPMLKIDRQTTITACQEGGVEIWSDPHNEDLRFTRVRVRNNVLPTLEENLGPGITQALVRSADLLRDDADALDGFANEFFTQIDWMNIKVNDLERLPKAIRSRVLRLAIYKAGSPTGSLSAEHIASAEALISDWHGQKEVALPGNVKLWRNSGTISLSNQ